MPLPGYSWEGIDATDQEGFTSHFSFSAGGAFGQNGQLLVGTGSFSVGVHLCRFLFTLQLRRWDASFTTSPRSCLLLCDRWNVIFQLRCISWSDRWDFGLRLVLTRESFYFAFTCHLTFRDLLTERIEKRSVNVYCMLPYNVVPTSHWSVRWRALSLSLQLELIIVLGYQHRNGYLIDSNLRRFRDFRMTLVWHDCHELCSRRADRGLQCMEHWSMSSNRRL